MQRGFTLVELIITVFLVAVLVTVAIPSFRTTMMGVRGSSLADKLVSTIHYARSEAITRNQRITLCASLDGLICNNAAANWNRGWIATRVNASSIPPNQTEVIRYWAIDTPDSVVNLSVSNSHQIIYKASGEAILSANGSSEVAAPSAISFQTQVQGCEEAPVLSYRRVINVAPFGAITVARGDCQ
jgi:type IV fimbrial biogenesis protein FimT